MIESLPYEVVANPWDGDGPSIGYGGNDSDPRYGGASDLVAIAYSLQYKYALVPPRPHTFIDHDPSNLYPTDNQYGDHAYTTLAKLAPISPTGDYQDTVPGGIVGNDYEPDISLQAPSIPLGGATAAQRSA